jgi:hypothetical protein
VATEEQEQPGQPSLIEALRHQREELASDRTKMISVPGFDNPGLLIEYNLMDGHELDQIQREVWRQHKDRWQRQILSTVEVMVRAAKAVYYTQNGGEPQPLLDLNEQPIDGFTPALAELLGVTDHNNDQRIIVFAVFGNKELFVARHSAALQGWMTGSNSMLDEEFLGEGL